MPAKSWDSYRELLYRILDEFRPERVMEFGSGLSTNILAVFPSVVSLVTIEHDQKWYEKIKANYYSNIELIFEPDLGKYAEVTRDSDLFFVDGRERVRCLKTIKRLGYGNRITILHDSDRDKYKEGIELFKHRIFGDEGNTVILTDDDDKARRINDTIRSDSRPDK